MFALTSREGLPQTWAGVQVLHYKWDHPEDQHTHRWMSALNTASYRGEVVYRAACALKAKGFNPDVIVVHTGWGEALFLHDLWPDAQIAAFSELWYQTDGGDLGFDPEFPMRDPQGVVPRLRMKNAVQAMQIEQAQALFTATRWQANSYPAEIAARMAVLHEGVDTERSAPDPNARFQVPGGPLVTRSDKVVSFVNRNLEPLRGFHVFMRSLPLLFAEEPEARVVIVGDTGVSYGVAPQQGGTWKALMLAEVAPKLTDEQLARVHFVGRVPHKDLTRLFQVTGAHVYLSYPFVAGWSLLEAMSCGAPVVGSAVAPVAEFVSHEDTGLLVDFFDAEGLVAAIGRLFRDRALSDTLGETARNRIVHTYDQKSIALPKRVTWVESLSRSGSEVAVSDPKLARTG